MPLKKRKNSSGQVLAGVVMVMMVLLIIVPAVVTWVQMESRASVKDQKSSLAFNLAEAAVDRGMWKLKSTTSTWANAAAGITLAGYNFDATYTDVPGGSYRVTFSTAANGRVQVWGEGRDANRKETRSIQATFANASLAGGLLAQGALTYAGVFENHWGPVMSQSNIAITATAATKFYPRKLSKQVVTGTAGNPRDTNGLTAPNTNNLEWWSNYSVPKLPLLDFATMRASAAATGTLNYYNGTLTSHTLTGYASWQPGGTNATNIHYLNATNKKCNGYLTTDNHSRHFYDSLHHPNANQNLVWYWDNDVTFTGNGFAYGIANCHAMGLFGTVVVRGNMTLGNGASDCYGGYLANIPANAWMEYQTTDTTASGQYPGDNGLRSAWTVYNLGVNSWSGQTGPVTDVGFRGLVYVGGNLTMLAGSSAEVHGVVWVVGTVTAASGVDTMIYFDGDLEVPVLNVILTRESWREVSPNTTAWP